MWRQMRTPSPLSGSPSLRPVTKQPPSSLIGIATSPPDKRRRGGYGRRARMKAVADRKVQGVDAKNQDFIRFDQVNKRQEYRLAEAEDLESFDETYQIKTVDIGRFLRGDHRDRAVFADELGRAPGEIGFAVLEGHGVDTKLYDEAADKVVELFTQASLEQKLRFRGRRHGSVN